MKYPHAYEDRLAKIDRKDNEFSIKQFYNVRQFSTNKKLLGSLKKFGTSLNDKKIEDISFDSLNKVCFLLINNYEDEDKCLGVGPLNDGYLVSLIYKKLGFNIFYLYNPRKEEYLNFLDFFMKKTKIELTVFYTGHDMSSTGSEGIEFINGSLSRNSIGNIIAQNCSGKARVLFITDCYEGGSVFDINSGYHQKDAQPLNMISFYVIKTDSPDSKDCQRTHGIFTYYFCKIISQCPNITPDNLVDKINPSLNRFNEVFQCEISNEELADSKILFD